MLNLFLESEYDIVGQPPVKITYQSVNGFKTITVNGKSVDLSDNKESNNYGTRVIKVFSDSDADKEYYVRLDFVNGKDSCTCPAFVYRKSENALCKHIKRQRQLLETAEKAI